VAVALHAVGREEASAELADELLEALDETTNPSERIRLGGVAALGGRDAILREVEAGLEGEQRSELVARCASYLDWNENPTSLVALLDRQEDPAVVAAALGALVVRRRPARGEAFRDRLVELVVERVRQLESPGDRARPLARIVNVGWVPTR
jgi:hypothetical protein